MTDDETPTLTSTSGTFARVWLVRLKDAQAGDENKVFALKILRKVDGMLVPCHLRLPSCSSNPPQSSVSSRSSTFATSAMCSPKSQDIPS